MGSGDYIFTLNYPIVFISLLLLLSYKIVSKINQKRSSSKHKTIPDFTYQNLKEDPSKKI
jgi:hypothetical protein